MKTEKLSVRKKKNKYTKISIKSRLISVEVANRDLGKKFQLKVGYRTCQG